MNDTMSVQGDAIAAPFLPVADDHGTAIDSTNTLDTSTPNPELAAETAPEVEAENGFARLGLAPELQQAVAALGYTAPTQVQQRAIPLAMGNSGPDGDQAEQGFIDLMVSSQTGSGKTAAFLLPVLHTLVRLQAETEAAARAEQQRLADEAVARGEAPPKRPRRKNPTHPRNFTAATPGALVLCPTRELAQQVAQDAIALVRFCKGLRIANVVGGMPYQMQIAKLQNANLVVATPGRLLDLQRSMQIKLDQVRFLVVDEADRMLDLGFSDDLEEINQLTQQRQQTMMFSATFAPRIQQLAMRVMHEGGASVQKIQVDTPQEKHADIQQMLYWADNADHKRRLLDHWLRDTSIGQAIVFASTQIECDGLAQDLQQSGFAAVALHGALSQGLRNRRLMALRNGQVQILVATDVAARGIDVPSITHVFNFGLPMKAEDYTHRIGRTGRAGRQGLAVTFAEFRDRRKIFDIQDYTRQPLKAATIAGLEPTQRAPEPSRRGDFGGRGRGRDAGSRSGPRRDFRDGYRDGPRGGGGFEGRDRRFGDAPARGGEHHRYAEPRGDYRGGESRGAARDSFRGDYRGGEAAHGAGRDAWREGGKRFERQNDRGHSRQDGYGGGYGGEGSRKTGFAGGGGKPYANANHGAPRRSAPPARHGGGPRPYEPQGGRSGRYER